MLQMLQINFINIIEQLQYSLINTLIDFRKYHFDNSNKVDAFIFHFQQLLQRTFLLLLRQVLLTDAMLL